MANEHDYILKLFNNIESILVEFKSETNKKLETQQQTINELSQRTLIPKDANRFDLIMCVLRENPNKTYTTVWLLITLIILTGKYDLLDIILKGVVGLVS